MIDNVYVKGDITVPASITALQKAENQDDWYLGTCQCFYYLLSKNLSLKSGQPDFIMFELFMIEPQKSADQSRLPASEEGMSRSLLELQSRNLLDPQTNQHRVLTWRTNS